MASRRNTGLTTYCAPASITARAVSASVTVPAPSRISAGNDGASLAMSEIASGTVIVTSIARTPPSAIASTTARSLPACVIRMTATTPSAWIFWTTACRASSLTDVTLKSFPRPSALCPFRGPVPSPFALSPALCPLPFPRPCALSLCPIPRPSALCPTASALMDPDVRRILVQREAALAAGHGPQVVERVAGRRRDGVIAVGQEHRVAVADGVRRALAVRGVEHLLAEALRRRDAVVVDLLEHRLAVAAVVLVRRIAA